MKPFKPSALFSSAFLLLACVVVASGSSAKISVSVDQPGHPVSPTLWGLFFEDINLSTDGGIYPELVRNRSFEDGEQPTYWTLINANGGKSEMVIDSSRPLNPLNRHSLKLSLNGQAALENEGYWGMNLVKGESYAFKVALRATDDFAGPISVKLLSATGAQLASGEISDLSRDWKYYSLDFTASASDAKSKLQISCSGKRTLFLDMVSLTPKRTWKDNGLRPDLAESLDALKPSFLRFPGGCWVEGEDMAHMYNWKKTIGDVDARTPLYNIWGYNATHGLGFHEYLQLTEDLGATPLFCINVGMSHREVIPMAQMGQWVQDALDAIEYANGPTNTFWGGLRAKHGHPAPYHLRYMEVGNENGTQLYNERWELFYHAIKSKYPEMQLVANLWQGNVPKNPKPDLIDEHYYDTPEFFMRQAHRYDDYDRNGPKIFIGEYAVTRNGGKGNLRAAIGEAAFMTGIERNSDIVAMASYAPLLVNVNHRKWNPDLINFDSSRWYGLPGYYVQKLFSEYRGDVTLPISVETKEADEPSPAGRIGVGTWNTTAEFKDIKVTALDGKTLFQSDFSHDSDGWKLLGDGAKWSVQGGALHQSAEREFIRALAGDKSWTDYTFTLKARKISGREGFLILFHIGDDEDRVWWNLGGWNNTQHAVELGGPIDQKHGSIETDRWYDIKVEVQGLAVKCWLDGKLVHDIKRPSTKVRGIYASATRDSKAGEIILKIVNASATPTDTEIALDGIGKISSSAEVTVLTSEKPTDENSLDEPLKVSPKTQSINLSGSTFQHSFPGNSLTVLRIKANN